MPYALIHGEALVACAAWALGESGVDLLDATISWEGVVEAEQDLVLHDALCPMAPPAFIAACLDHARATGRPVVGTRPVTDTVKVVTDATAGQVVGETLDRDTLIAVASPLVVPAAVLAALPQWPSTDLARAVADLAAAGHAVDTIEAPPEGRRVSSPVMLDVPDQQIHHAVRLVGNNGDAVAHYIELYGRAAGRSRH